MKKRISFISDTRAKHKQCEMDFDYNNDERFFSQRLVPITKGWVE